MDFYLQFGYGMMELSRELIERWGGGRVILSPRDIEPDRLEPFAKSINEVGGKVLFDPQFYLPDAKHHRLVMHDHWPEAYNKDKFWSGNQLEELLDTLARKNDALRCPEFILPGVHAEKIDDQWLERQAAIIEQAQKNYSDRTLLLTVSLGPDVVGSDDQVQEVLESSEDWGADGIYLVCESPNNEYLVQNPNWLANLLDLTAGFKLGGMRVVIGYANQQTLIAASAGADAIASGTWVNVRSFPPGKFEQLAEDERKQRATWHYCPQALSEYKIPYLDLAKKAGVLKLMQIPADYECEFADALFTGGQPSASEYSEREAFRHYLQCLKFQAETAHHKTLDATIAHHRETIEKARGILGELHRHRILGLTRDFMDCIDPHDAALQVLADTRGAILGKKWNQFGPRS